MNPAHASAVRLPAGVRDFLPRAAARRRAIAERLVALFERWGYQRIITPVYECADVLERGLGEDGRASAIRFVEPGTAEVVALRPDFTPQVARLAATRMHDVGGPLRLCYEGAVHRLGGGLARAEILQAGVELIEADPPDGDAEALAVAAAVLASMHDDGVADVRLDVGHVAPARAVLASAPPGPDGDELRAALVRALARKDRAGVVRAAAGLPPAMRPLAEALPSLWGPAATVLQQARALPWPAEVLAALDELAGTLAVARDVIPAAIHAGMTADLGDVRGFDYYTGLRLAGFARGAGDAVLRGGRYDTLVAGYGRAARAIGLAVDIEQIAAAQRAAQIALPFPAAALVVAAAADRPAATRLAAALRGAGLRAAVDLGARKTDAQVLAYARDAGFTVALALRAGVATIIGPSAAAPLGAELVARASAGDADAATALVAELVQRRS